MYEINFDWIWTDHQFLFLLSGRSVFQHLLDQVLHLNSKDWSQKEKAEIFETCLKPLKMYYFKPPFWAFTLRRHLKAHSGEKSSKHNQGDSLLKCNADHQFFSGARTPLLDAGEGGVELLGGGRHHLHRLLAARLHRQGHDDDCDYGDDDDGGDDGDDGDDHNDAGKDDVEEVTSSSMDGLACSSSTSSTCASLFHQNHHKDLFILLRQALTFIRIKTATSVIFASLDINDIKTNVIKKVNLILKVKFIWDFITLLSAIQLTQPGAPEQNWENQQK